MKSLKYYTTIVCTLALVVLTGCVDPVVTSELESPALKTTEVQFIPIAKPDMDLSSYTDTELVEFRSLAADASFAARRLMKSEASEYAKFAEISRILAEQADNPYLYKIEQIVVSKYLRSALTSTPGELDMSTISEATKILLKNDHQGAGVLGPAIESLVGHWTDAEVSSAATKVVEMAGSRLVKMEATASKRDCEECSGVKQILTDDQLSAETVYMVSNRDAIERLEGLIL